MQSTIKEIIKKEVNILCNECESVTDALNYAEDIIKDLNFTPQENVYAQYLTYAQQCIREYYENRNQIRPTGSD